MEEAVAGDASIVHENVDGTEIGLDLGDAGCTGGIVGHVPLIDGDAGLLLEFGSDLVIAGVIRRDGKACGLEGLGNGRADSARTTGNDCNSSHP